jgi:hypothetical protein
MGSAIATAQSAVSVKTSIAELPGVACIGLTTAVARARATDTLDRRRLPTRCDTDEIRPALAGGKGQNGERGGKSLHLETPAEKARQL